MNDPTRALPNGRCVRDLDLFLRLLGLWSYVGEGETIPLLQSINTLVPRSLVADGCGRAG